MTVDRCVLDSFGSLHQKDATGERTDEENYHFEEALKVVGNAYAHPTAIVLQHKSLPKGFPISDRRPTYDRSGWCVRRPIIPTVDG